MSKKYDKLPQFRVQQDNYEKLKQLQQRLSVKMTLVSLANLCLSRGLEKWKPIK